MKRKYFQVRLSDETVIPDDTLILALSETEERTQLIYTWIPDPQKL